MGCLVADKESTVNSLCDWINKVKFKKSNVKLQRRRNLLVQAVLSSALNRAEYELRRKQQERRLKWELLRPKIQEETDKSEPVRWNEGVCKEIINSLDEFMSQLRCVQLSKS